MGENYAKMRIAKNFRRLGVAEAGVMYAVSVFFCLNNGGCVTVVLANR